MQISIRSPLQTTIIVGVTGGLVVWLLSSIGSRRQARGAVIAAAALSGLVVLSLPTQFSVRIRPLPVHSLQSYLGLGVTAALLVMIWGSLWLFLFGQQSRTRAQFLEAGREISTRQAAVAAYLMITTAGVFLCSIILVAYVSWSLLGQGVSLVVWLLGGSLALPFGYLLTGSCYQLGQLALLVREIRTRCDRSPDLEPYSIPFEPTVPVWVLPEERFYAGAYWDPFDHAIVLSTGALEHLDDLEIATLIAHEESHFEHRGAKLQFMFAFLPAFALMGKNVVYSIYDFHAREFTADEYAVRRLNDATGTNRGADVMVGLLQRFFKNETTVLEGSVLTFLPTLQTTALTETAQGVAERAFTVFHGHFAGAVHPSNHERICEVRRRDQTVLEE
ncbi:M48 family metalloprotease [Haloferax prahovense]|uniref:M48 family metalloprotease n=1 Tax=Haloferax prahovense TaxID=381852 RepID=UPI003C73B4DD